MATTSTKELEKRLSKTVTDYMIELGHEKVSGHVMLQQWRERVYSRSAAFEASAGIYINYTVKNELLEMLERGNYDY